MYSFREGLRKWGELKESFVTEETLNQSERMKRQRENLRRENGGRYSID